MIEFTHIETDEGFYEIQCHRLYQWEYRRFYFENPFTGGIGAAFEKFHSIYEPDLIVTHPDKKPKLLSPRKRACRFCIREFPEVTFRKTAHVFPQLIGNRNIIHDCECDSCNEFFGNYDDSLSKFLGMTRTTDFMKGQSGIPSFKSGDGKFSMRYGTDKSGKHLITLSGLADQIKGLDNAIELNAIKQPYIPINVMKCLYKIGYSIMDPKDLLHFNSTRKIITSNTLDELLAGFASVVRFSFPVSAHSPMAVRYKKRASCKMLKLPSNVTTLHFGRYAYQFFLIDDRDTFMFEQNESFEFLFAPPPFPGDQKDLYTEKIELSSTIRKEDEIDFVIFAFEDENKNE
jgi:hypothetical protein